MGSFAYDSALTWIPLLPLFAAMVLGLAGRKAEKDLVAGIGIGSVTLSFALALLCAARVFGLGEGDPVTLSHKLYTWFTLQGTQNNLVPVDVRFTMDGLSAVMSVMVTGIGLLIHVYSASYMHDDDGFARFFSYLNLFMGSMLLLVLASSLPVLFVGWEGVGVCSYLLIGFWFKTPAYAAAAKKAFIVNRIGDLGVLLAMLLFAAHAGSAELSAINVAAPRMFSDVSPLLPMSIVTAGSLLLFLGCAGKSAQLPLYVWLPDAMAGPTPVSALIHAATMVTAGVYLCCRMSPVFAASHVTMTLIAVVGASTALLAATIAVAQNDLKKILAYSTVSQLGFMFAAIGVGAFSAGIFHVFTHAFFKACLFLGAGSVMHAVGAHGDVDVTKLGGLGKKLKITSATFYVATASISGFPLLAGFFSKDAILSGALGSALTAHGPEISLTTKVAAWYVLVVLCVAAILTAFYMTRCAALTFTGTYKGETAGYDAEPHESPAAITVPLVLLAVGAAFAGFLGYGEERSLFVRALGRSVTDAAQHAEGIAHWMPMAIGTALFLIGGGAGVALFLNADEDPIAKRSGSGLFAFLKDAWRVDWLYDHTILALVRGLSGFVAAIDRTFLELLAVEGPAITTRLASMGLVRTQNGYVQTYGLAMAVGLVGVLAWMQWPKVSVEVDTTYDSATFHIAGGLGQKVTVDLNNDGTPEAVDSEETTFQFTYGPRDFRGLAIEAQTPPNQVEVIVPLTRRGTLLDESDLGLHFRNDRDAHLPMFVAQRGREALIRPNGQYLQVQGQPALEGDEMRVALGREFMLARCQSKLVMVVRARITTTNVFGETRTELRDIVLRDSHAPATPAARDDEPAPAAAPHGAEAHP